AVHSVTRTVCRVCATLRRMSDLFLALRAPPEQCRVKNNRLTGGCYGHTSGPGTQRRTTPAPASRLGGEHRYAVPSLPVALRVLGPAGLESHARARRRSPRGRPVPGRRCLP